MPDIRTLISLFEAVAQRDWATSKSTALQIAEEEEQRGHQQAAQKLRGALSGIGSNGHAGGPITGQPQSSAGEFMLAKALVRAPSGPPLSEITLRKPMRVVLEDLIAEWHLSKVLQEAAIPRRSRVLFHGPPGCGKTVTALALARELKIPAYVVRFDALIGSYLGQTAARMREVFHFAANNKCLLLLDEIDVLGKRRGSQQDVGELDRIVVGLMQELDFSPPRGLVIGASNLAGHLDDALWRRFDVRMEFKAPNKTELSAFTRRVAERQQIKITGSLLNELASVRDYASAERLVVDEARRQIIRKHHRP